MAFMFSSLVSSIAVSTFSFESFTMLDKISSSSARVFATYITLSSSWTCDDSASPSYLSYPKNSSGVYVTDSVSDSLNADGKPFSRSDASITTGNSKPFDA